MVVALLWPAVLDRTLPALHCFALKTPVRVIPALRARFRSKDRASRGEKVLKVAA